MRSSYSNQTLNHQAQAFFLCWAATNAYDKHMEEMAHLKSCKSGGIKGWEPRRSDNSANNGDLGKNFPRPERYPSCIIHQPSPIFIN